MAGAVNLLVQRHPINSALSLMVVMGSLAVEYLLLGAEFVAAVQVIVYAGAIMVLFVFVIMLLNAGEEERHQRQPRRLAVRHSWNAVGSVLIAWVLLKHSARKRCRPELCRARPRTIGLAFVPRFSAAV